MDWRTCNKGEAFNPWWLLWLHWLHIWEVDSRLQGQYHGIRQLMCYQKSRILGLSLLYIGCLRMYYSEHLYLKLFVCGYIFSWIWYVSLQIIRISLHISRLMYKMPLMKLRVDFSGIKVPLVTPYLKLVCSWLVRFKLISSLIVVITDPCHYFQVGSFLYVYISFSRLILVWGIVFSRLKLLVLWTLQAHIWLRDIFHFCGVEIFEMFVYIN